jgi:hypothetical protein
MKMTLDGLARSMQRPFLDVRREMHGMRTEMHGIRGAVVSEMRELVEGMRAHNRKVLESNDKLVTRFDALLKEEAAHTILHKRSDDRIENHEKRLMRFEARN